MVTVCARDGSNVCARDGSNGFLRVSLQCCQGGTLQVSVAVSETVPAVPVLLSVSGKTVWTALMVPVSSSGSVLEPS